MELTNCVYPICCIYGVSIVVIYGFHTSGITHDICYSVWFNLCTPLILIYNQLIISYNGLFIWNCCCIFQRAADTYDISETNTHHKGSSNTGIWVGDTPANAILWTQVKCNFEEVADHLSAQVGHGEMWVQITLGQKWPLPWGPLISPAKICFSTPCAVAFTIEISN